MKSYKVVIAVISLALAAGLFGGYMIWGTKDEGKVDIKQLLRTLEEETGRIERKNKDLAASIEASKAEIQASEAVRKENQDLKGQLQGALQEKAGLESSLVELRAGKTDEERQAAEMQALRSQLARVREELAEANEKASRGEKLQLMSDNLSVRISELEKENRELKSAIDNISEITRRKQEAR
ncbi:MAG: hypothetical protein IH577_01525 [Deltaproteobacteria bacterium]|nr:hypothetical protein [Deltaproteobacteria bacterium]